VNKHLVRVALVALPLCWAAAASAADGWKLPLWNPFASSSRPAKPAYAAPSSSGSLARGWSTVTTGTKKALNTTVDVVTLKPVRRQFDSKPENPMRLGFKPDPRKKSTQSGGWWNSLFKPVEPKRSETVEDFFSLERPR